MIQKLTQLLQPTIEALGYELWGIDFLPDGRNSILRVFIDSANGIGLDDCQKISKQISALLDVEDPIDCHYSLEVSSPGLDRQLFTKEQYEQFIGSIVIVKFFTTIDKKKKILGTLEAVTDDGISVLPNDAKEIMKINFDVIKRANLRGQKI